ncbi:MAG: 50S ribosomal protein L7/L12 [Minisyncoccia bacterium]
MEEKFKDIIEKIEKLTVVELAELVKVLEQKFGVSAAAAVAVSSNNGGAQTEEKSSYNLILKSSGDQKINVIKLVKEITGLGLQESKALVDGAPKTVKEGLKKEDAEDLKKRFEAIGAVVELQ